VFGVWWVVCAAPAAPNHLPAQPTRTPTPTPPHPTPPTTSTASLGPTNWARWGYGCLIGAGIYLLYCCIEPVYNRAYGAPPPPTPIVSPFQLMSDEVGDGDDAVGAADVEEAGKNVGVAVGKSN